MREYVSVCGVGLILLVENKKIVKHVPTWTFEDIMDNPDNDVSFEDRVEVRHNEGRDEEKCCTKKG